MSTADEIKKHLSSDSKYWKNGDYRGPAPSLINSKSDGKSFVVHFEDGEHGWYKYHSGTKEGGSLYTLAVRLNIPLPNKYKAKDSTQARSLQQYEKDKGLPEGTLKLKGWTEGTHEFNQQKRPAIFIPAQDGTIQVRFLDNIKPRYVWKESRNDAAVPFYGTQDAVKIANEAKLDFILLVNGAGSVEACHHVGVPAFAVLGGEGMFSQAHADIVMKNFSGKIVIALDCDNAGRLASKEALTCLSNRGLIIDLGGNDKFDAADFCLLWGIQSLSRIQELIKISESMKPARNAHDALSNVILRLEGRIPMQGRLIPQPFTILHEYGGHCKIMPPDMLTGVIGLSGHGKTSWWHSFVMMLINNPRKFGFMIDGREFKPESDAMRRLQMTERDPALTYDALLSHEMRRQEDSEGIPEWAKLGHYIQDEHMTKLKAIHKKFQDEWLGHIEYAQEYQYVEDTLSDMMRRTFELREQDINIDVWIFDYLTLYRAREHTIGGKNATIANIILEEIKKHCRDAHVHGIVMMQPNKSPSAEQLTSNERLKMTDMAYANPDHFNLILGLNTLYGDKAFWVDGTGWESRKGTNKKTISDKMRLYNRSFAGVIEVLKTTFGSTGYKNIQADYENLRWKDESWSPEHIAIQPK